MGMISPDCGHKKKTPSPAISPRSRCSASAKEESSITDHTIKIGGQTIPYKATAHDLAEKRKGRARRADLLHGVHPSDAKDLSSGPCRLSITAGRGPPRCGCIWGRFRRAGVVTGECRCHAAGSYKLCEKPTVACWTKTDLVFIDPVGTGFQPRVGKAQNKDFWGVDQTSSRLAQFINTYVSRNSALELAEIPHWRKLRHVPFRGAFRISGNPTMDCDFNGIVLISSVLDLGTISFNAGEDKPYIFYLPSYAATAWYHRVSEKERAGQAEPFPGRSAPISHRRNTPAP